MSLRHYEQRHNKQGYCSDMFVRILLVALALAARTAADTAGASVATTTKPTAAQLAADAECEYSRSDCISCATRHADIDRDGRINATEVDIFRRRAVSWVWRQIAWIAQYNTDYVMQRCGDEDGFITAASLIQKRYSCLAHCENWHRFMPICTSLDKHTKEYPHRRDTVYDDPNSRTTGGI